jgi:FkbM family methyltransferase
MKSAKIHGLKQLLQRAFRAVGLEVQQLKNADVAQQIVKNLVSLTRATVVLDVGANVGQFGDEVLRGGFDGTIISFEAVPGTHRLLARHASARSDRWLVAPCAALGRARGEITINVSANSVSSSILPMRAAHLDAAPNSKYIDAQTVPVERLDDLAAPLLPVDGPVFLKIDTQGYELEVLRGAEKTIDRTVAIQVELSLAPMYDGAPTFLEMVGYLQDKGFEIFNLAPAFKDKRTGRMLQLDGFFVRSSLQLH